MYIAVKDHDSPGQTFGLHGPGRNGTVIEHAKPFPVVRERMVGPPGQIDRNAVLNGFPAGLERGAARTPAPFHKRLGPGKADPADLFGRQLPSDDPIEITPFMDSEEFFIRCRLRDLHGIGRNDRIFDKSFPQEGVFLHGERVPVWKG
jgi:hypothetical protein